MKAPLNTGCYSYEAAVLGGFFPAMDAKLRLDIVGLVKDTNFHVAKTVAEELKRKFPEAFVDPQIKPLLELEWNEYLCDKKRELQGGAWRRPSSPMCFLNGLLLGDDEALCRWAQTRWSLTFTRPRAFYQALAEGGYARHLQATGHAFVFMDVEAAGEAAGRLLFELFSDVCPRTSDNFRALCTGEGGLSPSGVPLCYKGSLFHRVVPNGWLQGGDITPERKGDGGEAVYGPTFEDESFAVPHAKRGVLGMANKGPHSNGSQFYITLQPTPWMDRTYVAFGRVVEGVDVLRRLEEAPTCNERPENDWEVSDCGEFQF
ncbi:probable inactive peptidyl-prolyl cis-trans isomerase-like 6 [Brachionichthys hirsutus]|uniref:probable inactive peptidyl-prolyl cis-trans isomerase-like 6 n=1 Tax=Brachionichthys hirsutus TaxID=412623 RepID=UPI003605154A